jgi:hypothetical protein
LYDEEQMGGQEKKKKEMEPTGPKELVRGRNKAKENARKRAQKLKKMQARSCADDLVDRGPRHDADSDDDDRHGKRAGGRKVTGGREDWGTPTPFAAPPPPPGPPPPPLDSEFDDCSRVSRRRRTLTPCRNRPNRPRRY